VSDQPVTTEVAPEPARRARLAELRVPHLLPLWLAVGYLMYAGLAVFARHSRYGLDVHAYWLTGHRADLYAGSVGTLDLYHYSPAFAQVIHPLTLLPWAVFYGMWVVVEALAFAWLLKPLGWAWGVPAFLLCGFEIYQGNIVALLAVALVLGVRRFPETWALAALTKVVVAVGFVWFAVRGEWRNLLRALGATALIAAISFAVDPGLWHNWIRQLLAARGSDATLPYRVGAGLFVAGYAARRNRAWLLAPAMLLANPVTNGMGQYLTILAAIPRLRAMQLPQRVDAP
jgi:hypothetical protein